MIYDVYIYTIRSFTLFNNRQEQKSLRAVLITDCKSGNIFFFREYCVKSQMLNNQA